MIFFKKKCASRDKYMREKYENIMIILGYLLYDNRNFYFIFIYFGDVDRGVEFSRHKS